MTEGADPDDPAAEAAAGTAETRSGGKVKGVQKQIDRFRVAARGMHPRKCSICGETGLFTAFGNPPRFDARCGSCGSLERHRLFALYVQRFGGFAAGMRVLHFAPERQLGTMIRARVKDYETADLSTRLDVTHHVDIEATGLPSERFDRIVCSHVLEHVDDRKALAEMFRMLKPGGRAYIMSPVVEGWAATYENPEITDPAGRLIHFGQADHCRIYGRDIRDRIRAAGFTLDEFTAVEPDVLTYGLVRGETLFIATRP
jgi:SAM-dependent methyltransferase